MNHSQKVSLEQVDAAWMKFLGLLLQEGLSWQVAEELRKMEAVRLQAGLPAPEELAGCPSHWAH